MEKTKKVTRFFSKPLMKQNIRSNWMLCVVILVVMVMMSTIMNYAASMMPQKTSQVDVSDDQERFYTYLGALATYNSMAGMELSYDDFVHSEDTMQYDQAFQMMNAQTDRNLSTEGFQSAIDGLKQSDLDIKLYVKQFEYSYALAQSQGVFDQKELTMADMLDTALKMMGIESETIEKMSAMDTSSMITRMYYTVTGLLPIFILIVILSNSLIAEQVDRGSMAYVLSTPIKRSAVVITQMIFLVIVPFVITAIVGASRIVTTVLFYGDANVAGLIALFVGMYVLIESVCGICYLGSCWFSQSKQSLSFGGGFTTWFFLTSLIGMFGTETMVNTGMGVEQLAVFNKLTLIGLYDIDALATVGTNSVDNSFVWKLVILAVIAVGSYLIGAIRFTKKDLPL